MDLFAPGLGTTSAWVDSDKTYTVNASGETNDGSWFIQVQDRSEGQIGYLDRWSMTTTPGR